MWARSGHVAELTAPQPCDTERLARVAHELRNSLAAMGAALRLLEHDGQSVELGQLARETLGRQIDAMAALVAELER